MRHYEIAYTSFQNLDSTPVHAGGRLWFVFLLFLFHDFGLLHHGVSVAVTVILEHFDKDVSSLEEIP